MCDFNSIVWNYGPTRSRGSKDVVLSINKHTSRSGKCLRVSLSEEAMNRLGEGERLRIGHPRECINRIYIMRTNNPDGFKLTTAGSKGSRMCASFPVECIPGLNIDDLPGNYLLEKDKNNDAFIVIKEQKGGE